jgi:hypothetical protein
VTIQNITRTLQHPKCLGENGGGRVINHDALPVGLAFNRHYFPFCKSHPSPGANPQCAKNAQFGKVPAIGVEALHG